jgi:hypothetical protein
MTHVLLIWEEVPEAIQLFLLEGKLADLAVRSHNQYVNSTNTPDEAPVYELNDRIYDSVTGELLLQPLDLSENPYFLLNKGAVRIVRAGFLL